MGKFFKIGFYAVGTFLLLFSSIIVGANFVRDSGVFDKPVVEVKKQTPAVQSAAKSTKTTPPKTAAVQSEPAKTTPAAESTVNNKALVVEVINCTEKDDLAEEVRAMLESQGYQVSAGNNPDPKQDTSQIIIRKKGANTDIISNMFKISVIKEELQQDSRFDITVIIGSDFNP